MERKLIVGGPKCPHLLYLGFTIFFINSMSPGCHLKIPNLLVVNIQIKFETNLEKSWNPSKFSYRSLGVPEYSEESK